MPRPLSKPLPQLMTARMIRDETGLPAATVRTLCDRLGTVHTGGAKGAQRVFRRDDVYKLLSPPDSRWRSID